MIFKCLDSLSRYYTSIDQVRTYAQDYHLSIVGTIMHNRINLPDELRYARGREVLSSVFVCHPPLMLVSYIPKRGKNVLVVSTMHKEDYVTPTATRKPDVILFYNETKGGVDTVDQMIDTYRTKAASRRWPMVVFYTIVDVAALNAMVILKHTNNVYFLQPKRKHRRQFLLDLGMALVTPQVETRAANLDGLQTRITKAMSLILGRQIGAPGLSGPPANRSKCVLCVKQYTGDQYKTKKSNKANKTNRSCPRCNRKVCGTHFVKPRETLCIECDEQNL